MSILFITEHSLIAKHFDFTTEVHQSKLPALCVYIQFSKSSNQQKTLAFYLNYKIHQNKISFSPFTLAQIAISILLSLILNECYTSTLSLPAQFGNSAPHSEQEFIADDNDNLAVS